MSTQFRSAIARKPEPAHDGVAQAQISGHAEIVRSNLRRRRQRLAAHDPKSLLLAAVALAAGHEASRGHVAAMCADKARRKRAAQLVGEAPFDLVDVVAVGESGPEGRSVALAVLGIVLAAWNCAIKPIEASDAPSLAASAADVMEGAGRLGAMVMRAREDGQVTPIEAEELAPHAAEHVRDTLALQAEINHARLGCPA